MAKTLSHLTLICLTVWLTGCVHLFKPPVDDPAARELVGQLIQQNNSMSRFKGLADLQMSSQGRSQSARIAFATVRPDKMRVELLNMMGTPLTSLSGDGEHISILSHGDRRFYRIRQTPTALDPLIQIPIGIEDMQNLLAGGVPIPPHASAHLEAAGPDTTIRTILLKNRWHEVVAKLDMDANGHQIKSMDTMGNEGEPKYRIVWQQWRKVGEFTIPAKLILKSSKGQQLNLTMGRFWPNAEVTPSTFVLIPPE